MNNDLLYSASLGILTGALLLPVTMPGQARAAESFHSQSAFVIPIAPENKRALDIAHPDARVPSSPIVSPSW